MTKEYTITLTSKGQFTMPVQVRRAFGIDSEGGKLTLLFNPQTKQAKIEQPASFETIQSMAASYMKPGVRPLENPRAFYEQREPKR